LGEIAPRAQGLGLTVVAEGVETEQQQALLHEQSCDEMIQGFHVSKPVTPEAFFVLVAQHERERAR
jgi:EAL domain-containing protein (putative c-di-GMP-specific phosphodiesterase class I)